MAATKPPRWLKLSGKSRTDAITHDAMLLWVIKNGIDLSAAEIANFLGISRKTAQILISESEEYRQGEPITITDFSFDAVLTVLNRALAISTTTGDYTKVATAIIAAIKAKGGEDDLVEVPEEIADKIN